MKALRLRLFQETACYKKPSAFKVGETYPLPPYSTVKGMLHHLIDADSYVPMKICIQGNYETRLIDYQRHYFYKKTNVSEFPLILDGLGGTYYYEHMTTMPIYMHLLLHVYLVIHVAAADEVLKRIQTAIQNGKAISLGRWEDLVRVDECQETQLRETDWDDEIELPYSIYWPADDDRAPVGVPYRLNWKYEIREGIRQWKKISVRYVQKGEFPESERMLVDNAGLPVIFPKEMEE